MRSEAGTRAFPRQRDIVACGELLVDFVSEPGVALRDASMFERAAGGAPANVAVGLARLGYRAGFLGQVGDDGFGQFLRQTLHSNAVDVGGLRLTDEARTALAFVSLQANGERDFLFYRHPSADMLWSLTADDASYAASGAIFHFGSISLIADPSRTSTFAAVAAARRAGAVISYDPNLRLPLWPSREAARAGMLSGLRQAQIAKLSLEELEFLCDQAFTNIARAARSLWHDGLRLLCVTKGAAGCVWFTREESGEAPAFAVRPVDTTGAGDGFVAGLLAGLLETNLTWDRSGLEHALRLAAAVGALTTTRRGAIPALPDRHAVELFLSNVPEPAQE